MFAPIQELSVFLDHVQRAFFFTYIYPLFNVLNFFYTSGIDSYILNFDFNLPSSFSVHPLPIQGNAIFSFNYLVNPEDYIHSTQIIIYITFSVNNTTFFNVFR